MATTVEDATAAITVIKAKISELKASGADKETVKVHVVSVRSVNRHLINTVTLKSTSIDKRLLLSAPGTEQHAIPCRYYSAG